MTLKEIRQSVANGNLSLILVNKFGDTANTTLKRFYVKADTAHMTWNVVGNVDIRFSLTHAALYTNKNLVTVFKLTAPLNIESTHTITTVNIDWSQA